MVENMGRFYILLCASAFLAAVGSGHCQIPPTWNEFMGTEKNIFPPHLDSGILAGANSPRLDTKAAILQELRQMLDNPRIASALYSNYLSEFSKEERSFSSIFQKNLMLIAQRNVDYHTGLSSWSEGINQFTDMPEEELRRYYGLPADFSPDDDNATVITSEHPDFPLNLDGQYGQSDSLDWRSKDGKSIVTPVKNQGGCGSCWAFSTVGPIESAILKAGKSQMILSEQNLVDCASKQGCSGEWPQVSLDYMKKNGVALQKDYPYTGKVGTCQKKKPALKVKSYIKSNKEGEMKTLCDQYGPFSLSFFWHGDMGRTKNGVYDGECGDSSSGHAITVVGYGNEGGKDFWIVKNSWGEGWADKGYFKIIRGTNKCGIETYIGGYFVTI